MDEAGRRDLIGPRADYYLARFARMEGSSRAWVPSWNWAAFFFSTAWFAYRRMPGWAALNFFLPIVAAAAFVAGGSSASEPWLGRASFLAYLAIAFLLLPMYANRMYYRHVEKKASRAKSQGPSKPALIGGVVAGGIAAWLAALVAGMVLEQQELLERSRFSEGLAVARNIGDQVSAFHAAKKRLPGRDEAKEFRWTGAPLRYTDSVAYDAEQKWIVIRMRASGKSAALQAQEAGGRVQWHCRTIDLPPRHMPASCRP